MSNLRRLMECFECERYYPFTGWSKTLLATERDAYCDRDGDWGFPSKAEYANAVTSPGWFWEQGDWQEATADVNVDAEGWSYGVSFDSFGTGASEAKGPVPGGRRSSGVFLSDPRLSAQDQEDLSRMESMNAADARATAAESELEPLTSEPDAEEEAAADATSSSCKSSAEEEEEEEEEAKQDGPGSPTGRKQPAAADAAPLAKPARNPDKPAPVAVSETGGMQYTSPGAAAKSMLHFVRRRRILRWQCFDAALITRGVPLSRLPCSHCDLAAVEDVAAVLLSTLAAASITAHPRQFNEPKCNALKTRLIAALRLDCTGLEEHSEMLLDAPEPVVAELVVRRKSMDGPPPVPPVDPSSVYYSMQKLTHGLLQPFRDSCSSAGASVSGLFAGGTNAEVLGKRTAEVAGAFFPYAERRVLAQAIIKVHDVPGVATGAVNTASSTAAWVVGTGYVYHCKSVNCGSGCRFAHEVCRNEGCEVEYSRSHREEHVSVCQYQLMPCPRAECHEQVPRKAMDGHVHQWCAFRPSECPFKDLGCMTPLTASTVPDHVEQCHASHSLLMLARMNEQQSVIKKLHKEAAEARAEARGNAALLTAALASIEIMQAREGVDTMHEVKKLKAQVAQLEKLKDVEGTVMTRMTEVSKQVNKNLETERTRVNLEFGKVAKAIAAKK